FPAQGVGVEVVALDADAVAEFALGGGPLPGVRDQGYEFLEDRCGGDEHDAGVHARKATGRPAWPRPSPILVRARKRRHAQGEGVAAWKGGQEAALRVAGSWSSSPSRRRV